MAQPTPYDRQANFANEEALNPTGKTPGTSLDAEFNAIKVTSDQTLSNLARIQRDDGELGNATVGLDQLKPSLSIGFTLVGAWEAPYNYVTGDGVSYNNAFYRALSSHLSVSGQTPDIRADLWQFVLDFNDFAPAVIPDGGVTLVKLIDGIFAVGAAGLAKFADGFFSADAAGRSKVADGFLTNAKVADATLTNAKVADATLTNAKVADATLTYAKAAANEYRAAPKLTRTITSASSSGDRTLTAADIGKLIVFSGTTNFTVTFSAAATLANGWSVAFAHEGKCVVTLDPNGSETIDGATTGTVLYKQTGEIFCDGSVLRTIGKQSLVLLEAKTFSGVGNVDFTSIAPGYRTVSFKARELATANNGVNVNAQFSIDNGSNWRATSGDYLQHNLPMSAGTQSPTVYSTDSSLLFVVGNALAGRLHDFDLMLHSPSSPVARHRGHYVSPGDLDNGGSYLTTSGRFVLIGPSATGINAIRFLTSSGNFAGTIALYGEE